MPPMTRRWPRIDLVLQITLRVDDLVEAARTLNVSREGLFVTSMRPRPVGTQVRVAVLVEGEGCVPAEGVVIHANPDPADPSGKVQDRPRGMGIYLTKVSPRWERLCDRLARSKDDPANTSPPPGGGKSRRMGPR
jgi:hypothetical protein